MTTELQLNLTGSFPADGSTLETWTQAPAVDALGGVARGTLLGPDGEEYAHATGWFHAVDKNSQEALDHYEREAARPLGPETEAPLSTLLGLQGAGPGREAERPTATEDFQPGVTFAANDSLRIVEVELHSSDHSVTGAGAQGPRAGVGPQVVVKPFVQATAAFRAAR
ncbi:hypothetical protein [Citricoccus alkalitolerans]|uniref:Uncharacterized protein n=1 Tax=Citricoccus alkalitolerans TaxID=246603 RepID=A0ABV8XXH0_9MICC